MCPKITTRYLVGGFKLLWNIWIIVSWDFEIPDMWKNSIHVPNYQPDTRCPGRPVWFPNFCSFKLPDQGSIRWERAPLGIVHGCTWSVIPFIWGYSFPICFMYGIFAYIWGIYRVDVGKYTIHETYSIYNKGCEHVCYHFTKWDAPPSYQLSLATINFVRPVQGHDNQTEYGKNMLLNKKQCLPHDQIIIYIHRTRTKLQKTIATTWSTWTLGFYWCLVIPPKKLGFHITSFFHTISAKIRTEITQPTWKHSPAASPESEIEWRDGHPPPAPWDGPQDCHRRTSRLHGMPRARATCHVVRRQELCLFNRFPWHICIPIPFYCSAFNVQ